MVSGEGAHVVPKDFSTVYRATGAMIDVVGAHFGMKQRGRGWPLFYGHGGTCVAPHVIGYTPVPIWWYGFSA
jgi:hypothetical protein